MNNLLGLVDLLNDSDLDGSGKAFEYLGGTELTAAAAATAPVFVEPRALLVVIGRVVWTGATASVPILRFNGDTAANYWYRNWTGGEAASVFTAVALASTTHLRIGEVTATTARSFLTVISNVEGVTHPALWQNSTATGTAATGGAIQFGSGEWVSTAVINSVQMLVNGGTASFGADTGFAVFGADL